MRRAINLAAIHDGKLLLVKKKQVWILPGGKPEIGETDLECLTRELSEELPQLTTMNYVQYGSFVGITPHAGDMLEAIVFLGEVNGEIKPSREISDAQWFGNFDGIFLSDITKKIIESLKRDKYLKNEAHQ